jgi:hypothetical protein
MTMTVKSSPLASKTKIKAVWHVAPTSLILHLNVILISIIINHFNVPSLLNILIIQNDIQRHEIISKEWLKSTPDADYAT